MAMVCLSGVNANMIHELDARGLLCPLPVLKTRKRLMALEAGDLIDVSTDDPAAVVDMPHFCAQAGHRPIEFCEKGDVMIWRIEKGPVK